MNEASYIASYTDRLLRKDKRIKYGINFLDDMTGGIHHEELITIGARTGSGKTQIATQIALNAIEQGKKVFFFALEAYQNEIVDRIKYMEMAKIYFENRSLFNPEISFNFTDWLNCNYETYPEIEQLEMQICKRLDKKLNGLQVYTPETADFNKMSLDMLYEEYCKEVDLVIIDHVHYLLPEDRESEYDHLKKTMILLRNLINKNKVPIIAMSHLRKSSFKERALVPPIEELHGSSELSKQSNHVITISSCYKIPHPNPNILEEFTPPDGTTFIAIPKTRTGQGGNVVAVTKFDLLTRKYEGHYYPYKITPDFSSIRAIEIQHFPKWMKHAKELRT